MKTLNITTHKPMPKKWLYASLAAAALTLGACADKEAAMTEDETAVDAQTEVEQGATGVASADTVNESVTAEPMAGEDVAVASDNMTSDESSDMMNDDVATAQANDGVAVGTDDSEMLDGTESEEHVSTY